MQAKAPRIAPLAEADVDPDLLRALEPWRVAGRLYHVFLTYARHPALSAAWGPWGAYVFARSTLSPRHRELLILRTAWLCASEYEFAHHSIVGRRCGLDDTEITRVAEGPEAEGWTPVERALLRAADELEQRAVIGDATWATLVAELGEQGIMDAIFTCGTYRIGASALRSFGTPLEPGLPVSPKLAETLGRCPTNRSTH